MPLQGLCFYPGIAQVVRASYTLSHGISPSVAVVEIAPQADFAALGGRLEFGFGQTTITLNNCRIDRHSFRRGADGLIWGLEILDRRWKWRETGELSGRYNLRDEAGAIDKRTEKNPRELAQLCLDAMGERGADVSRIPNLIRPEIEWDYHNPAEALASLCDELGCRVVLGLNDKVSVWPVGSGQSLPRTPDVADDSLTLDPPERPDSLKVVGGPTRYQALWKLQPVGLDTDGTIKPIDDLSYKPSPGWESVDPRTFFEIADEDQRLRAVDSVWRWYKLESLADDSLRVPGFGPIDDVAQVLPIDDVLLATYEDPGDEQPRPQGAALYGVFYDGAQRGGNTPENTHYRGRFEIDRELGIVKFQDCLFKESSDKKPGPAELYFETSFGIRQTSTRTWRRYTYEKRLPGPGFQTGPKLLRHEELVATVRAEYDEKRQVTRIVKNESELDGLAREIIAAAEAEYQAPASEEVIYNGLVAIHPDGAIQQVTWTVGVHQGASTRASRNNEFDLRTPSHRERRQLERLRADRLKAQEAALGESQRKRDARRRLA